MSGRSNPWDHLRFSTGGHHVFMMSLEPGLLRDAGCRAGMLTSHMISTLQTKTVQSEHNALFLSYVKPGGETKFRQYVHLVQKMGYLDEWRKLKTLLPKPKPPKKTSQAAPATPKVTPEATVTPKSKTVKPTTTASRSVSSKPKGVPKPPSKAGMGKPTPNPEPKPKTKPKPKPKQPKRPSEAAPLGSGMPKATPKATAGTKPKKVTPKTTASRPASSKLKGGPKPPAAGISAQKAKSASVASMKPSPSVPRMKPSPRLPSMKPSPSVPSMKPSPGYMDGGVHFPQVGHSAFDWRRAPTIAATLKAMGYGHGTG